MVRKFSRTAAKNLFGVWQQDANNVWVCGGTSAWKGIGGAGAIYHLDVSTGVWTLSESIAYDLHGLWGFGDSDIYCVGHGDTLLHYDGTAWAAMVSPVQYPNFSGVGSLVAIPGKCSPVGMIHLE